MTTEKLDEYRENAVWIWFGKSQAYEAETTRKRHKNKKQVGGNCTTCDMI